MGDAANALPAAQADAAKKRELSEKERPQKVLDAAPCLKARVRTTQSLPLVSFQTPAMSPVPTRSACVLEKAVRELPDNLFKDLIEMMVPPANLAWRGEVLGKFLERSAFLA